MKNFFVSLTLLIAAAVAPAFCQLTIDACQEKARANYPLVRQYGLLEQLEEYTLSNANKGYLPQLTLSARGSYQSDVTEIPIKLPGIEPISKDQYQAVAEVSQTIWDGGAIGSQKNIARASSAIDKKRLEVDMYALNDRVNQLFFGILLLTEQLNQNEVLQTELQTNYTRIAAYIQNGVANQADLSAVKVEQLNAQQRRVELVATQKSFTEMLAAMIGEPVPDSKHIVKPEARIPAAGTLRIDRPELKLFDAQAGLFYSQRSTLSAGNLPKIAVFLQGCYGRPGLDMLKNDFTPYYIGGLRLTWNFGNFYTYRNNTQKITLSLQSVEAQKATFLFNTSLAVTQQSLNIDKYNDLMKSDDEIIALRRSIKNSAQAKVENGTLSVTDLLREINAENLACQEKALHEIQLLMSIYNLRNTTNDWRTTK
jgi:outer membrane protein TolC